MDDLSAPPDAQETCAPKLAGFSDSDLPSDFVPLRLLLQPGGLCVHLDRPNMIVGRHSQADIRLSLPDISRRHCRFVFADGGWQVIDLYSLNGVFVNGERLHESILRHGDRVRIASLIFEVDLESQVSQAPIRKAS
jgi:pSer/pThr/pTyr-binding forkhead associated (FHA) protein